MKQATGLEFGEEDVRLKKKLNMQGSDMTDAFIRLCNYAERHEVPNNVSSLNYAFETMPRSAPEFQCLSKLRQCAGSYKSFIETTQWMLTQRRLLCIPGLKNPKVFAQCCFWGHLFQCYKDFCVSEAMPLFWGADFHEFDGALKNWFKNDILTSQTLTEKILVSNRIQPTAFVNAVLGAVVHGTRRQRTLMLFSRKHRCGKSVIANALKELFDGVRITLEDKGSREFVLSAAVGAGLVVCEDPSESALNFMVRGMRAHMDGDEVPVNKKHQAITHSPYPPIIITSNICNTTQALGSRCRTFVFEKTMGEVFGSQIVNSIPPTDIVRLLAKYTFIPMCNSIYNDHAPLANNTSLTQCVDDTLLGHSPWCKFMNYFTRMSKRVTADGTTVEVEGVQEEVFSIERIQPQNCGVFCTKEAIEMAKLFLLTKHQCLHRGDLTGLKVLKDKTKEAYEITAFYDTVMVTMSGIMHRLLAEFENDFVKGKDSNVDLFVTPATSVTSVQYYNSQRNVWDYAKAVNNAFSCTEFELRDGNDAQTRTLYHKHLLDCLFSFLETHGVTGPRNSQGHFTMPLNLTLHDLYLRATGALLLSHSELGEDTGRLPEEQFG
uniref:EO1 n=1 Tax=Blueface angelfish adomavirus TaxID=2609871 RepID=A0A6F9F5I2_9VIRU|nr:TPA_asm: EO1 [Blueface angelfish adomavirus]